MAFSYNMTPYNRPIPRGGLRGTGSNLLFDLNQQINRLFDDFFDSDDSEETRWSASRFNSPVMDVLERENRYDVNVELPGVKFEDVELKVEDGILTLTGEKKRVSTESERNWTERKYGAFQRRIQLPKDIDEEHIEAEFENGVLTIMMPRIEEKARGRRIELKNRSSASETRLIDDNKTKVAENA